MNFVVILKKGADSFGAYVPDLPGCVAIGEPREEMLQQSGNLSSAYGESSRKRRTDPNPR
jgi:predicted RNase H-like HicB family nuclease